MCMETRAGRGNLLDFIPSSSFETSNLICCKQRATYFKHKSNGRATILPKDHYCTAALQKYSYCTMSTSDNVVHSTLNSAPFFIPWHCMFPAQHSINLKKYSRRPT